MYEPRYQEYEIQAQDPIDAAVQARLLIKVRQDGELNDDYRQR